MKKLEIYLKFINECRNKGYDCKIHRHHIIPKFMGGDDSERNIVELSYEDHQKAHIVLANCFSKNSFEYKGNIASANILQMHAKNPEFDISGENHPRFGESCSPETKKLISESVKKFYELHPEHAKEKVKNRRSFAGDSNPMYGQGHKLEGDKNGRYGGKGTTEETRSKLKKFATGREFSKETHELWSKQRKGKNNPMHGKSAYDVWVEKFGKDEADRKREETIQKMKNSLKGRKKSPETIEKMKLAARNRKR